MESLALTFRLRSEFLCLDGVLFVRFVFLCLSSSWTRSSSPCHGRRCCSERVAETTIVVDSSALVGLRLLITHSALSNVCSDLDCSFRSLSQQWDWMWAREESRMMGTRKFFDIAELNDPNSRTETEGCIVKNLNR